MANKIITEAEFEILYGTDALTMLKGYAPEMQKKILSLPADQLNLWVFYRAELDKLYKRKYQLEDVLDRGLVAPEDIVKANTQIENYENSIREFQNLAYQITADQRSSTGGGSKFPDRGGRDGAVSIRPSNISEYTTVPARQRKK